MSATQSTMRRLREDLTTKEDELAAVNRQLNSKQAELKVSGARESVGQEGRGPAGSTCSSTLPVLGFLG